MPIEKIRAIRVQYGRLKGEEAIGLFIAEKCRELKVSRRSMQRILLGFSRPFVFAKYGA